MAITALPTPPTRSDPTNFSSRADAFMVALPTFATEANALQVDVNAKQVSAANSETNAAASALAAAQTAGVTAWVSGTTYALGVNVYDTTDFLTYRRKVAGAGTTRPGLDTTNWKLIASQGDVTQTGTQTLTNKTLSLGSNTVTATLSQLNTAVTDANVVSDSNIQSQTYTAFTTAGTAPAFTLTPTPAITSYSANQRFRVKFNAAGTTGSNTLNVSGLGDKNLKQYDSTGAKVAAVVAAGLFDVEYDGTDFVILDPLPLSASTTQKGVVQLATSAEAQALSDSLKAITPATLAAAMQGANQSLTASGYQKLPGGLIIQWGEISHPGAGANTTFNFPISFTSWRASPVLSRSRGDGNFDASSVVTTDKNVVGAFPLANFTASYQGSSRIFSYICIGQ